MARNRAGTDGNGKAARSSIRVCPLQRSAPIFPARTCPIGRAIGISVRGRGQPILTGSRERGQTSESAQGTSFSISTDSNGASSWTLQREEEKRLLVAEAERLLGVYGDNHSVRQYLGAFLDAARVVLEPAGDGEPRFERSGYELPLGLRVAIGRMAKENLPLSADWLLGWYIAHPEHWLRTAATRAFPEFRALFTLMFCDRFPEGLKMRTPRRLLRARYASASRAFEVDLEPFLGDIPDISGTSKPLAIAKELVEEATDALDKYSRFLGRNPQGRDTIEAPRALAGTPLAPVPERRDGRSAPVGRGDHRSGRSFAGGAGHRTARGRAAREDWQTSANRGSRCTGTSVNRHGA